MPLRRLAVVLLVAAGCGRTDSVRSTRDSGLSGSAPDSTPAIAVSGEWPPDLGAALAIPSDTENVAVLLYPATASARTDQKARFTLVAASGDTLRVRVAVAGRDSAHCGDAPMIRLARAAPMLWSLGLSGATARPMRSDSIDAISHEDSLLYSTEAPRLASVVSATATSRLSGLPFALTALRRVRFGDTTIIAAQLARRVNQEANPAEERTFVIAERHGSLPFATVHSDRSDGTEETAAHFDLLGALRTPSAVYLIIATDAPSGSTIEILERSAGAWRVRWTRTIVC